MRSGYIYFLRGQNDLVKIGRTKDLTHRIRTLTRQLDFDVKLVGAFYTSNASKVEAIIHNRLSNCLYTGEWYILPEKKMYKTIRHFSQCAIEMM